MAISDSQIQDLINKTNIIYNLVNNQLSVSNSQVLSAVNNTTNAIQNRLTQTSNQARSDTNLIYNNLTTSINNVHNTVYTDIQSATSRISIEIQKKVDAVSQAIQKKVDTSNEIIQAKLNTLNAELKDKITSILAPILLDVVKTTSNITQNITNAIQGLETDIKSSNYQTQVIIKETESRLNSAIQELSKVTADLNDNKTPVNPLQSGIFGSAEPAWITSILERFYAQQNANRASGQDNFFTGILRLISGDSTANAFNSFNVPNIGGALSDQIHQITTIIERTSKGEYSTLEQFYTDFKRIGVDTDFVGGVLQFLFIIPSMLNIGKQLTGAFDERIQQLTRNQYNLRQLSDSEAITAFIRNVITYEECLKYLDDLGYKLQDAQRTIKASLPRYNERELFTLAHLGKISPEILKTRLRELGWNEFDAVLQGYLNSPRPGINDLIQFAVKEVYSPDTYNKFGQYLEFPKEFGDRAKLEGLDETYAKQYWAAHWDLPSATMGYDMFHRGIISMDELKALLKALDVMPFWREKLVQLSYNVVGRVDARRLYAYGIWDKQKVYTEYLRMGYSPKDSEDLTKFTVQYDDEQDSKHKTKLQTQAHNVYIKAYNNRILDKQQTKDKLSALGYKEKDIALELSLEDYETYIDKHKIKFIDHSAKFISLAIDGYKKRAISKADLISTLTQNGYNLAEANIEADLTDREASIVFKQTVVKEIQKLYFESLYDDNAVLTKLMGLGFENSEALHMIAELQILKDLDDKKPTPAQFEKMYKKGIIGREEYKNILAESGYNDKYIEYLILLAESE